MIELKIIANEAGLAQVTPGRRTDSAHDGINLTLDM